MINLIDRIIKAGFADRILTDVDLDNLFNGTSASRHGLVNKALKKGDLVRIRRGLYLLADCYRHKKLSTFFLASRICPHSYISEESALSCHGWIPERVSTVTGIIAHGRTKKFITPFGEFSFYHLPVREYEFLTGVRRVEEIKDEPFLLASPLRALADLVYTKKIAWEGMEFLTDGLRIEIDQLEQINPDHFSEIKNVYRSTRVLHFLDRLKEELKK